MNSAPQTLLKDTDTTVLNKRRSKPQSRFAVKPQHVLWRARLVRLTLLVSLIFMVLPMTDIKVSGWFVDGFGRFPLHQNTTLLALRDLHRLLPALIVPALLLALVVQALYRRKWLPAPHRLLCVLSVYLVGALLVVHGLKLLIGRARPNEITELGGELLFSPAWQLAQVCQSSCSFPSGEAASAAAMLAVPLLLGGRFRFPLAVLTGGAALVFSINRIVMGAHFLSDVVLSWLFVALTVVWFWPVFERNAVQINDTVSRAGRRIRGFFSR